MFYLCPNLTEFFDIYRAHWVQRDVHNGIPEVIAPWNYIRCS